MNTKFIKDTVERTGRTFLQGYLGSWLASGAAAEGLWATDNLKVGLVAAALSIAMAMGLKKVGPNKESASIL